MESERSRGGRGWPRAAGLAGRSLRNALRAVAWGARLAAGSGLGWTILEECALGRSRGGAGGRGQPAWLDAPRGPLLGRWGGGRAGPRAAVLPGRSLGNALRPVAWGARPPAGSRL